MPDLTDVYNTVKKNEEYEEVSMELRFLANELEELRKEVREIKQLITGEIK